LCSLKVGHLIALRTGGVQLVHHIHQEEVDGFQGDDEGELWALTGAGGTASMLVIGTRCAYDRLTGDANTDGLDNEEGRHHAVGPLKDDEIKGPKQGASHDQAKDTRIDCSDSAIIWRHDAEDEGLQAIVSARHKRR
jgi:hypothetical protein